MNIYYLKKFRKIAQKVIKARYAPISYSDKSLYDCTRDGSYINGSMSKDLFELQQKLSGCRRDYILQLTQYKRKEKISKQLAKL